MATSNFHSTNTSKIFGIEIYNDYDYDDAISNVECDLKALSKKNKSIEFVSDRDIHLQDTLRSYPAQSIGYLYKNINYLGLDIEVVLVPKIVSGYYSGANLDYEIQIEDAKNGEVYDSVETLLNTIGDYIEDYDINKGIWTIHKDKLKKLIEIAKEDLIEKLEKIFEEYSIPYKVADRFSNGETIYTKV